MTRTDVHLDAMLRHLGAAYYESLHGRATRSDVTRALDSVEEHLKERIEGKPAAEGTATGRTPRVPPQRHDDGGQRAHHRYARRVRDVMTTSVITVDRITPYKEITRLLTEHRISGVPVLTMGRHVAGVVSEADLLAVEDKAARQERAAVASGGQRHWLRARRPSPVALVAGDLMTSPPVTIHPDATVPGAARVMNANHVRRLPVVDEAGTLMGIVSRRDLLSVFLRPDSEIEQDAKGVLEEILLAEPGDIRVLVRNGVVTLTGAIGPAESPHGDLIPVAVRLLWDVDGVVDVVNHLGEPAAAG